MTDCDNYVFSVRERNVERGGRKFGRWQRIRDRAQRNRWSERSMNEC
jgi:hypothetical protein